MARSTFKFHIDFDTDDGYLKGKSIDLPSSTPEVSTFNRKDPGYDRAKWEDFLVYDLKNEIQHRLHEYVEAAVKDFLDKAEQMNDDKSKKGKKK